MKLYLLRHGEAKSASEDTERSLNQFGQREIELIGQYLENHHVHFRHIYHSEKARSRETAEIIARYTQQPSLSMLPSLSPDEEVQVLIDDVAALKENIMLVGHMPTIAQLSNYLLNHHINMPSINFQTGTLACLSQIEPGIWQQELAVHPAELQK